MKILDLEHVEAQFGLLIREKENHDNYALLRFEDLDKVIIYYNSFKDQFNSKSNGKKTEKSKWFPMILHYLIWWIFWNGMN